MQRHGRENLNITNIEKNNLTLIINTDQHLIINNMTIEHELQKMINNTYQFSN